MSIPEEILKILLEPKYRYKGVWVNRLGLPTLLPYKQKILTNALCMLKKKKYITTEGMYLKILPNGKQFLKRKSARLRVFESPFATGATKNLLVLFDIPEKHKAKREWFRHHLHIYGYLMIQKSAWVGPSPLPKEFIEYLEHINLKNNIKTFKLAKGYRMMT